MRPSTLLALSIVAACSSDPSAPSADAAVPTVDAGVLSPGCPVADFAPCGGDLQGTWNAVSFCPEDPEAAAALFEHPYSNLPECSDRSVNTVVGMLVHTGTVTFAGGTLTTDVQVGGEVTYGFTDACLAAVDPAAATPQAACDGMPAQLTCAYTTGLCSCSGTISPQALADSAPYETVDATTIRYDGVTAAYCTDGEVLILDWAEHPVSWRYWILSRP